MWWGCGEACTGACTQLCGDQSDIALAGVAGHQCGGVVCCTTGVTDTIVMDGFGSECTGLGRVG